MSLHYLVSVGLCACSTSMSTVQDYGHRTFLVCWRLSCTDFRVPEYSFTWTRFVRVEIRSVGMSCTWFTKLTSRTADLIIVPGDNQ